MKRVLSLALALFATVAVFAACNKDDKKEEVKEEWPKEFTGTVSVEFEGKTYSTDNKTISVEKGKEENTVTIIFNKIKFVPGMPMEVTVNVPGVKYEVQKNGTIKLSGDNIVPQRGKIPFNKFTVTDLKGVITDKGMGLSLKFGPYPTSFSSGGVTL